MRINTAITAGQAGMSAAGVTFMALGTFFLGGGGRGVPDNAAASLRQQGGRRALQAVLSDGPDSLARVPTGVQRSCAQACGQPALLEGFLIRDGA
jgi:hypothetical protein